MEDWVQNSIPKFQSAIALLDTPGTKPLTLKENSKEFILFENQYKAKEILSDLLEELEHLESLLDQPSSYRKGLYSSLLNYYLGIISVETEELSAGENHFTKALQFLDGNEKKRECCVLAISIRNQLGILWSGRSEHLKASKYLEGAAAIYQDFKTSCSDPPIPLTELIFFDPLNDSKTYKVENLDSGFGKCHVYTLYYLAQVYKHLEKPEEAAIHCHKTLKWQIDNSEFDQLEWSLNCAALSQFFVCRDNFVVARYLLGCASYILNQVDTEKCDQENLKRTKADVARCWAALGMALLSLGNEKPQLENGNSDNKSFAAVCKLDEYALIKEDISQFENKLPCDFVQTYDDAKTTFLVSQSCLNEAKEHYTFNEYASDYVNIIQDTSKLYKSLTLYEKEKDVQCKMHKRRADLLEETLKSLNRQYWLAIVRQLLFELGELYSEMMDLKYMLQEKEQVPPQAAKKINMLTLKSITHFFSFINSFKQSEKLPDTYSDEYARPALLAHFYIARLYSKIISSDPQKSIENLQLSKKYYDYIANYVEKHPEHRECVEQELKLVHELQDLLPQKIQRIVSSTLH